jgi:glycosyltransferase involved in cell wall biosynthesis
MYALISVITINKNNAQGLRLTIQSVLSQNYGKIEYIIIDGGSEDESISVIKQYEKNIDFWVSEPDRGIYHAMNKGIRKANGKYCLFLNSGDQLATEDVFHKMLSDNKDESIIYGNLQKVFSNEKKIIDKNNAGNSITMLNLFTGTINHCSTLIKRDLFDRYGLYDESLEIVADWKFFLEVIGMNNESIVYKDCIVSIFNMDGVSNSNKEIEKKEREKVLRQVLPLSVYSDYANYGTELRKLKRIYRYSWAKKIFWVLERILFRFEKKTNTYINKT